jgi:UDP-glucose 4-epimerase
MFNGKTVLVTGGTGTFGNAFVSRIFNTSVKEIRVLSRDELKQDMMRRKYQSDKIKYFIGDVRDKKTIDIAMNGVDYVFHAAALKQVPSCEFFPMEAVKTNVLGTENVLDSAIEHNVSKVVVLSTDKAAYPINAMGMSKALMEKVAISKGLNQNNTVICRTRYGNVMCSRGSVIPLFLSQIKEGKDITVTVPTMTRFMMTIEDAVELVLFAFEHGEQGDLFIKKAPAAEIQVLANALIELNNSNSKIKIIGNRHGEKMYEVLVTKEEMSCASDAGNFYVVPSDKRSLNYNAVSYLSELSVPTVDSYNSNNAERLCIREMKELLIKAGGVLL